MDLEKLEWDTQFSRENFDKNGVLIIRNFFEIEKINLIRKSAEGIFERQFKRFGYSDNFDKNIKTLFRNNLEEFINCGKTIQQGLWELYEISIDPKLKKTLIFLGVKTPNICTRPVLFFNHKDLAKDPVYYKTPPHQDWISMQSSDNSLVVWVPLVDVKCNNGSVIFYPGTHKLGKLEYEKVGGFAKVNIPDKYNYQVQPELNIGDIAIFSTFLVHESGDILDDSIRWSCHFRYNDLDSRDFINRGFPNPYEYKPIIK